MSDQGPSPAPQAGTHELRRALDLQERVLQARAGPSAYLQLAQAWADLHREALRMAVLELGARRLAADDLRGEDRSGELAELYTALHRARAEGGDRQPADLLERVGVHLVRVLADEWVVGGSGSRAQPPSINLAPLADLPSGAEALAETPLLVAPPFVKTYRADIATFARAGGGELRLVHELGNPYDPNAIRVVSGRGDDELMLGYLPRDLAAAVHTTRARGRGVGCTWLAAWPGGSGVDPGWLLLLHTAGSARQAGIEPLETSEFGPRERPAAARPGTPTPAPAAQPASGARTGAGAGEDAKARAKAEEGQTRSRKRTQRAHRRTGLRWTAGVGAVLAVLAWGYLANGWFGVVVAAFCLWLVALFIGSDGDGGGWHDGPGGYGTYTEGSRDAGGGG